MNDDHQLLLYIAAKVARLDAVASSIHAMLYVDLAPADDRRATLRQQIIHGLFSSNI